MEKLTETQSRPRACGYVRVSSRRQADEGNSLRDQREAIIRHAVISGVELVDVFVDGGISGGKTEAKRPGLSEALESLRKGAASMLIVKHVDRLSRDAALAGYLEIEVRKAGGRLVIIDEAPNDPIRNVIDRMIAEIEKIRGSQRMRFVHAAKKARGERTGGAPFGFSLLAGKLVENTVETPTLRKIEQLHAAGLAAPAICDTLKREGFLTRSGAAWSRQTVHAILKRAGVSTKRTKRTARRDQGSGQGSAARREGPRREEAGWFITRETIRLDGSTRARRSRRSAARERARA